MRSAVVAVLGSLIGQRREDGGREFGPYHGWGEFYHVKLITHVYAAYSCCRSLLNCFVMQTSKTM